MRGSGSILPEGRSIMPFSRRRASWFGRLIVCVCLPFAIVHGRAEACAQTASGVEQFKARLERFERIARDLYASGIRVQRPRADVWVSPQDLPAFEREELADAISNGIDEIEHFLRLFFGPSPIEFFVTREFGDTSTYYPGPPARIFLALSRIETREATYLHEAVHHLVFRYAKDRTASVHRWLFEGFPNFVQAEIVARAGGAHEGKMIIDNQRVDAEARKIIDTPAGAELVSFVGRTGTPPDLDTERERVGRPYYLLGQSFTKYLVGRISLRTFARELVPLMINAARFEATLQALTGKTVEQLRLEWLREIERAPQ